MTGRTITRVLVDPQEWGDGRIAGGQPEFVARFTLGMYQAAQQGFFAGVDRFWARCSAATRTRCVTCWSRNWRPEHAGLVHVPERRVPSGDRHRDPDVERPQSPLKLIAEQVENARLKRQLEVTTRKLATTAAALEIMGEVHALLDELSERADNDVPPTKH